MSDVKYKKQFLPTSPHHTTLRNFTIMAIEKLGEKEKRKTRIVKTTFSTCRCYKVEFISSNACVCGGKY